MNDHPLDLTALRENYARQTLSKTDVVPDPIAQFAAWFREVLDSQLREPNAMTLATATRAGRPSARTVLLKGFDPQGFVFYTNYGSKKGQELAENPLAALLFTWLELERQIRIEGQVEKITPEESLTYFQSRPKASQIGAWVSQQSQVIADRAVMETEAAQLREQYAATDVLPLPPFWGGYRLRPDLFEFWQGRRSRLHDRIQYSLLAAGDWRIERLAP
ncbi:MAG: pyridoxamine 5'-phosphate oxidase [Saprospiraceae bacterium]|nr:pyridoxamine 5'-phosphate oxidase [Saprospiraceae bacterium]